MKKNICFLCDGEFVFEKWYGKCEHCRILRPDTKERLLEEMDNILLLQKRISERLHDLEQKHISIPNEMTSLEIAERDLWIKHNILYQEIMIFMDQYDTNKELRQQEIYPRLYFYIEIAEQIKKLYS